MSTYTYPGVYIEEIPSSVHTITGVATSIAAFIGWAPQGPVNAATLVQSWSDYTAHFGGLDPRSVLGYAVYQFFGNGGQQAYIVRLVSSAADGVTTNTHAAAASVTITGLTFDTTTAKSTVSITKGGSGGLTISAANPGNWGSALSVQIQPRADDYSRFTVTVLSTDPVTAVQSVLENFTNLSLSPTDPLGLYAVNVLNERSQFLVASNDATTPLVITHNPTTLPAAPKPAGSAATGLTGGNDGTPLAPTVTPGTPGGFEKLLTANNGGVNLLDQVPIFNLLAVPGEVDPATIAALQQYVVDHKAFLIVDCQQSDTFSTLQNGPDATMTGVNATNAGFYFPWANVFDPIQKVTRPFPPSGFVAGLYAATDAARGVWKAPAGINASLTGQSGLATVLTDAQNGTLNPQAINCLRHFPVYGDVIWGARTMRGNDQVGSEWKYVPIRRLSLFLEVSLYQGTQWVVFEPNDETLWGQIRLNVGSFLQGLFLKGAFAGTTPQQAYFVKCDAENNPPASVAQGIVTVLVGFAPLYPAEFVVIQIAQIAGQSQS